MGLTGWHILYCEAEGGGHRAFAAQPASQGFSNGNYFSIIL